SFSPSPNSSSYSFSPRRSPVYTMSTSEHECSAIWRATSLMRPARPPPDRDRPRLDSRLPERQAGALAKVRQFYGRLVERVVPVSSVKTAELTKLFENTFRHINIALVNELPSWPASLA